MIKHACVSFIVFIAIQAGLLAQDTIRVTPYGSSVGNLMHDIKLGTHYLITDKNNNILPWYSADLGESYDYLLMI